MIGKLKVNMDPPVVSQAESRNSMISKFFSGFLNEKKSLLCRFLFDPFISRVTIAQEYVDEINELSKEGLIVFAQKNKSQLNCLIMRDVFFRTSKGSIFCHAINMSLWQPLPVNIRIFFSRLLHHVFKRDQIATSEKGVFKELAIRNCRSIIYLRSSDFLTENPEKDPIFQLIHAQKELNRPVYIVPVLVSYGRRRERTQKTLLEIITGMKENPGPLRRTITFLRYSRKGKILCSRPVNLSEMIEKHKGRSPETISYNVRRELIERIDNEKRAIFGPVLKSRDELIETVLRDTYTVKLIEDKASAGSKDAKTLTSEAKKNLKEISADFNEIYIEIWYKLLSWLCNNIYDGIVLDKEGLDRIKEISKTMPFVIIPCHRSHIDYPLLHYIFEDHEIQLPFSAVGSNLSFWPLGAVLRKSGVFFLRESFQRQEIYEAVLSKYIKVLLKEGYPVEFFIEGGRSRTGKMTMPRYGLLSMIIQAFKEGISDDLALIPVFIGYDKIIEEKSYLKELGGEPKTPEKAVDLIKSGGILRKRFGSVYVNIGEPIFLKSYLSSLEKPYETMPVQERQSLYRRIGYEIVGEINKSAVVTPSTLTACSLLCHYRRGIAHNELINISNQFCNWLAYNHVKFASTLSSREKAIEDALELFEQSHLIEKLGIEEEDRNTEIEEIIYSVPDEKRLNLEYYKNNILNFFVSVSFVSVSILSNQEDSIPLYRILEDYRFFKRLFKNEFIFDHRVDDLEEVNRVLDYMLETGMILGSDRSEEDRIEVRGRGRVVMRSFAGLIHNYFESYWVVIRACSYLKKGSRSERDFRKKIQSLGTRMYKKGEITRGEALSTQNYNSAILFLVDAGILTMNVSKDKKGREALLYTRSGDKVKIESLRQRIFKFL
jgi:glycerol-3-phosphate O-acyltransferase